MKIIKCTVVWNVYKGKPISSVWVRINKKKKKAYMSLYVLQFTFLPISVCVCVVWVCARGCTVHLFMCRVSLCWTWRVIAAFVDCWRQVVSHLVTAGKREGWRLLGHWVATERMDAALHQPHMDELQTQGQWQWKEDGQDEGWVRTRLKWI